jgi:hypothetical protein
MALMKIIFSLTLFPSITIFSLEVTDKIKFRRIILSKYPTIAFRIKSAFYGQYPLWKERILRRIISDNLKFSNSQIVTLVSAFGIDNLKFIALRFLCIVGFHVV